MKKIYSSHEVYSMAQAYQGDFSFLWVGERYTFSQVSSMWFQSRFWRAS